MTREFSIGGSLRVLGLRGLGLLSLGLLSFGLLGCGDDSCADLEGALSRTAPGGSVSVSGCTINGTVDIPDEVTLDGSGDSRIIGNVTLGSGSGLVGMAVDSPGTVAISAAGPGAAVTIRNVGVRVERGAAISIADRGATLDRVTLEGNVEDADVVPTNPMASDYATHGLVLSNAGSPDAPVLLTEVSASKFARFGALFLNSHASWNGGQVANGLTTGLMADGGSLELTAVVLGPMMQGVQVLPAFGGLFVNGCDVSTRDLAVDGNQGYGLLHDGSIAAHENLVATGNGDAALWVQRSSSFALTGENTEVSGNVLAGLVVVDTPDVLVRGATFRNNTLGTRISGTIGRVDTGDGIQAQISDGAGLVIDNVTMVGNERVGVILDVASGNVDGAVMNVSVDGSGEQLGAIAQGPDGLIDTGAWDATITRLGDTTINDEALSEKLSVLEIVGPMFLPPSGM